MQEAESLAQATQLAAVAIKNLERRWGVTLVSFLSPELHPPIRQLQADIAAAVDDADDSPVRSARHYIEFAALEQLHCTHLTLVRSDPAGPVRNTDFVRPGHGLFELFEVIQRVTSQVPPIDVELSKPSVDIRDACVSLVGSCADEAADRSRRKLMRELVRALPDRFSTSMREWDTDPTRFHRLHCTLGCLKRMTPGGFPAFARRICNLPFNAINFTLSNVSLIHHRYRTLAFPQEGMVTFRLGESQPMDETEFAHRLNLCST